MTRRNRDFGGKTDSESLRSKTGLSIKQNTQRELIKSYTKMSVTDPPECISDRNYTRADLTFEKTETRDELYIQYNYEQEKDDEERFELLEVNSPKKGVYARFMVIRSRSSVTPHVFNISRLIPQDTCKVQVAEKKKKKGKYHVVLKKVCEKDVILREFFTPQRPPS